MNQAAPRRWLLVSREWGVPREEGGGGHWSLDHLFLDQEGVPTLVEVKRSSDTRLRREVVGQMLDYAREWSRLLAGRQDPRGIRGELHSCGQEPRRGIGRFCYPATLEFQMSPQTSSGGRSQQILGRAECG